MRISRIYQPVNLDVGIELNLTSQAAHYVAQVLRLPVGAQLSIFDGNGAEFSAEIIAIKKQQVSVRLDKRLPIQVESTLQLHLGQGICRGDKMDHIIQKAVELGVTEITPLLTERCGVKLAAERLLKRWQHWQAVAVSACEQCGRNTVPLIAKPQSLAHWLTQTRVGVGLALDPNASLSLPQLPEVVSAATLVVGPEGGLTQSELKLIQQYGFNSVRFGPRILRTETAPIAALAILQYLWGDLAS